MMVPQQVTVAAAQLGVSPLQAHDSGIHGAGVGQEHQADIGIQLAQVAMAFVLLQLFEPQIKLTALAVMAKAQGRSRRRRSALGSPATTRS